MARIGAHHVGCAGVPLEGIAAVGIEYQLVHLQVVHLSHLLVVALVGHHGNNLLHVAHFVGDGDHLARQFDGVGDNLCTVVVAVGLVAEDLHLVFVAHLVDGIAVLIAYGTVVVGPQVADGELAQCVLAVVVLHAEHTGGTARLADVHLGLSIVGLHHLGVVRVVVPYRVALLVDLQQRVGHLLQHVAQVYLRQRGELDVVLVFNDLNALRDVFQRRQQGRELARLRVGVYIDVLGVAALACPCGALDGGGVALEGAFLGAHLVVIVVEEQALVVQLQRDACRADVVLRRAEAYGQRVVALTAAHTAHEVDQRGVLEVADHRGVELVLARQREAALAHHRVLAKLGLHIVLADGHADPVLSIGIGLLHLAVVGLQLSVHVELYALHGDVGAGVGDTSLHRERRHVLEVDVVGRQARRNITLTAGWKGCISEIALTYEAPHAGENAGIPTVPAGVRYKVQEANVYTPEYRDAPSPLEEGEYIMSITVVPTEEGLEFLSEEDEYGFFDYIGTILMNGEPISCHYDMESNTLSMEYSFTTLPQEITYRCTAGDGNEWTKGSGIESEFTFSRSVDDESTFAHFTGIQIDGEDVAETNYAAEAGSVNIRLSSAYLETLSEGEHTLTAVFDDGAAEAAFTVLPAKKDGEDDSGKTDDGKDDSGKTDDGKDDSGKTDDGKDDSGKTDNGKDDSGKTDDGKNPSGGSKSDSSGKSGNGSGSSSGGSKSTSGSSANSPTIAPRSTAVTAVSRKSLTNVASGSETAKTENTTKSAKSAKTAKGAATGDESQVLLWAAVMVMAMAVIRRVAVYKR